MDLISFKVVFELYFTQKNYYVMIIMNIYIY